MGIPDEHMLYIEHVPVLDRPSASEGFPVTARIVAHSRTDFEEGTPVVFWRTLADANDSQLELESPALWDTAPMTLQPESEAHQYLAHIPTQPVGTVIQYYLQARDGSGRNETHPYIGEAQAHTFTVTALGANVSAVSAQRGGAIEIYLNLGPANAQQAYRLMYSIQSSDTDSQGLVLPETTVLTGFEGALDDLGIGAARMAIAGPLTSDWSGRSLRFSLELADQQNTVVGAVDIQILD